MKEEGGRVRERERQPRTNSSKSMKNGGGFGDGGMVA